MDQMRSYVQILRALEGLDDDRGAPILEDCKHRTLLCCKGFITKDMVENELRPLLPSEVIFLNDRLVTHIWDEEGTSCSLFAGPASSESRASIEHWVKDGGCSCYRCSSVMEDIDMKVESFEPTFIFHLAVRCDSRMVSLINQMRTFDNAEFAPTTSAWHSLLNAEGASCLHIAAVLGKPAIVRALLLQKPETLNRHYGDNAFTLMHVIADSSKRYPRNEIEALMSETRVPRVDMHARASNGKTPLETAFSRHMVNAETIYRLMSPRDQDSLDFGHLLSIIVGNTGHNVRRTIDMIRLITTDRTIDMTNARSSPYNAAIQRPHGDWNQEKTDTAMAIWKALVAGRVPLDHFDAHGTTPLAHTIENAPLEFLGELDTLTEDQMKQLRLNFLTLDKDGDTPHALADRRDDRRFLDIVKRNIERQSERPIPNHGPHSAAMAYMIRNEFGQCLECLAQLSESPWRQITIARAYLGSRQCELALKAISNLEECAIVQRLKGSILMKAKDYKGALHSVHDAYNKEARSLERKKLQRRYCWMALSLLCVSNHLPFLPSELIMHIYNTETIPFGIVRCVLEVSLLYRITS